MVLYEKYKSVSVSSLITLLFVYAFYAIISKGASSTMPSFLVHHFR